MCEESNPHCWIYRSSRQEEMYLYLREEAGFSRVPQELLERFGIPSLVIELELTPTRQLARADISQVRESLATKGFYLQMPPKIQAELYDAEI